MEVDAIIKESDEKMQAEREAEAKAALRAKLKAEAGSGTPSLSAAAAALDPVLEARRQAARERDRLRRLRKKQEKLAAAAAGGEPLTGEQTLPHADGIGAMPLTPTSTNVAAAPSNGEGPFVRSNRQIAHQAQSSSMLEVPRGGLVCILSPLSRL